MNKKVLLAAATVLVFGLAVVAIAYTGSTEPNIATVSCCCCSGDSCPMKNKDAAGKAAAAAHEGCECCGGDADSCPMMKKDASGNPVKMASGAECPMMKKDAAAAENVVAGDAKSCPMMKKADGAAAAGATDVKHEDHHMKMGDGKNGCSCACCRKDGEKTDRAKV
jgi:hypothetical protein